MIDLHSHLLPGVDDGSRSVEQSVAVLARLAAEGVTGICLTPHLMAADSARGVPLLHDKAYTLLQPAAPAGITLYRGAEIMLDRPLDAKVARDRTVTLNGSRFVLVEFPRLVTLKTVEQALTQVLSLGLVPLLAHPERYRCCSVDAAKQWKALGALLQVDGPTLLTARPRGERARDLVVHGLADVAAADNHGESRSLKGVRDALLEMGCTEQATLLLEANPAAIIEDRGTEPVPTMTWRRTLLDRFRAMLDPGEDRP
ncbi:MAG TPA: CpsB/CapC family capsule biosynthesis tyrosine phosphatase [Gemmatimonadales bacterium]|nr:CpsB/CapC family capsule biosynthesis tyrosine phosphatase [Gemmatimonadales bacterium]